MERYRGRAAALATMHGKERAFARPFRALLGLDVALPPELDTDQLGSFDGRVPRAGSAEQACRHKALVGMASLGLPLGMASEGSFGPHPALPVLAAGLEVMVFLDQDHGLEIWERLIARRTNFDHRCAAELAGLEGWPQRVGFPDHGLIVRPEQPWSGADDLLFKDLQDQLQLAEAIGAAAAGSINGRALVETDMRAHRNPTRMACLRTLATRLARRISTPCPACGAPGWGRVEVVPGLPCGWCTQPTSLARAELFGCVSCSHTEELPRPDGWAKADPQHCPLCNP
ncbi:MULTISPECIES: DUF6671 family protein [unclassified Synechococcus]|uniref:DUF6671 family protein n=1 Tax=unclassified Synechococcus TaxID=2626047 RepID=UPI00006985F2|nr:MULTISPECIES: DUF6671 family protein [unclassified Synechococcus]EAQ75568.1 hypothetical protein WH5701_01930 [Synechococcus sp. WH 5701]WFN59745.1 hypothetical protein N4320_03860 [Synechococcus sp. CCFWC 502]